MCRSYGTLKNLFNFQPWIEIHGYNIDRPYGTFRLLKFDVNFSKLQKRTIFSLFLTQ
jgi:hypothetical protein